RRPKDVLRGDRLGFGEVGEGPCDAVRAGEAPPAQFAPIGGLSKRVLGVSIERNCPGQGARRDKGVSSPGAVPVTTPLAGNRLGNALLHSLRRWPGRVAGSGRAEGDS